jgi:hypothetical protein
VGAHKRAHFTPAGEKIEFALVQGMGRRQHGNILLRGLEHSTRYVDESAEVMLRSDVQSSRASPAKARTVTWRARFLFPVAPNPNGRWRPVQRPDYARSSPPGVSSLIGLHARAQRAPKAPTGAITGGSAACSPRLGATWEHF